MLCITLFLGLCRIARADPFWEVYDTLVMPPQLGKATAGRMRVQNYHNQSEEWTVSMAGPAKVNLSSSQLRLLRDSPHEYQLQVSTAFTDCVVVMGCWPANHLTVVHARAVVQQQLAARQST